MFSVEEVATLNGTIEYRRDQVTGLTCRINAERIKRGIDQTPTLCYTTEGCPFCPVQVEQVTPTFQNGSRIVHGESVTFPNLFPFAAWHTVSVITRSHMVDRFTPSQIEDALRGQVESLTGRKGFASINWNFLPSAGASLAHPHLQGLVDAHPPERVRRIREGAQKYHRRTGRNFWLDLTNTEGESERFLFGDTITWIAHAVPVGEKEILGIFPGATLEEFPDHFSEFTKGILSLIDLYRAMGTHAFNLSVFFIPSGKGKDFRTFCSLIARINPNPTSLSDSSFMERLHLEPLILTSPEDLAAFFHRERGNLGI
ncbi:MAG: galactose-1-phosphate uridylyltransferase [Methanomicrobiales archaeon]|nr:galactose-1-phosphate uridylyltransferase [Methanomicrobiales archaeon]